MKLADFKQERKGARPLYSLPLDAGDVRYELSLSGPATLVKKMFSDADFEVKIDPAGTQETFDKELSGLIRPEERPANLSVEEMEAGFGAKLAAPTLPKSVLLSLRRVEGDGTLFLFTLSGFPVPANSRSFFSFPPALLCQSILRPATGNQDLRLWLAWLFGVGVVSSSTRLGTAVDVVAFGMPFPFVPIIELAGVTAGTCGTWTILTV
jgi:hypothetical protein